jgi:hypothetical protein
MKEIAALWAYTLARAATAVVEYSSELMKVISGEYFNIDEVSSPEERRAFMEEV